MLNYILETYVDTIKESSIEDESTSSLQMDTVTPNSQADSSLFNPLKM